MPKCKTVSPPIRQLMVCALSALGAICPSQANAENEFVSHTVESYGSSGMCAGDVLANANEDDDYFDNGLTTYGQLTRWTNASVDGRDFADASNFAWGEDDVDSAGTDYADVIFFSGHSDSSCTSGSQRAWLTMGDSGDGCSMNLAHVTASSRHSTWGGTTAAREAEVLVTFACETTAYCVYTAGGYNGLSQGEFNLVNGFHGLVYEVSGYQSDLGSYSNDTVYNYVGDAWLDWMYDPNASGSSDNCPSAIGFGANTSETDDFYTNAGWLDFRLNGARSTSAFYKLCGCDPVDGAALPSC